MIEHIFRDFLSRFQNIEIGTDFIETLYVRWCDLTHLELHDSRVCTRNFMYTRARAIFARVQTSNGNSYNSCRNVIQNSS